jgi:hypothetical protein
MNARPTLARCHEPLPITNGKLHGGKPELPDKRLPLGQRIAAKIGDGSKAARNVSTPPRMAALKLFWFEQLATPFLSFLLGLGEKRGNKLLTAFANVAARLFEDYMTAKCSSASCHALACKSTESTRFHQRQKWLLGSFAFLRDFNERGKSVAERRKEAGDQWVGSER